MAPEKTSTVEILEGLRTPDSGRVSVCGLTRNAAARSSNTNRRGLQSPPSRQDARARALDLFGSFYPRRRGTAELLKRFGL